MPAGSATSRSPMTRSATCSSRRAPRGGARQLPAALAIGERLADADPGNAGWQRDLSVSHDKIGDVLMAQGNLAAALTAIKAALAIGERLAKADPGNAGWQRDLSVSHNKIGDVLRAQGNLAAALTATRPRSRSASASPRPTPAMPAGSATSRSPITRSATCCRARAIWRRRSTATGLARDQRASGRRRPRQRRLAARPGH